MENITRLLLVDDDADDCSLFVKAANEVDKNIFCIIASNGQEAIDILRDTEKELPDYIFLDLRMPKVNGRKCLEEIRTTEHLKHIPVIIYSTSKDVADAENLTQMGANHFITKPSNPDEIYYLLSQVLSEKWV